MKKLFLLLLCLSVSPVLAQNATPFCTTMATRVHIRTRPGNPQFISLYSREEFLQKAETQVSPYTLGLTVAKLDVSVKTTPTLTEQLGQICVGLSDVDIEMSYPTLTVYIDKKYMPSSCAYQTIKEHENYHVAVAQQALSFFRPDVENAAAKALMRLAPKIVYSKDEIQGVVNKLTNAVVMALQPVVNHINGKLIEKNAAIDTKEMYQATTAVCKDW